MAREHLAFSEHRGSSRARSARNSITMTTLLSRLGLPIPAIVTAALLASCAGGSSPEPLYGDMTEGDVKLAAHAAQDALEHTVNGETRTWRNPATGSEGAFTPQRTYLSKAGLYCRDYRERLVVSQRSATYRNTACRSPEGVWRWVSQATGGAEHRLKAG